RVARQHLERHGTIDRRAVAPVDGDAALWIRRVEHLGTIAPVYGDAPTARDEADDRIPRERIAALGVANELAVETVDANAIHVPPREPAHELLEGARLELAHRIGQVLRLELAHGL